MASVMNKEEQDDDVSNEYEKQRLSFIADLRRFNENRGTPFDRIPEIGGQEVDLYHLYQRVTAFGGWHKVNNEQLWEQFQEEFAIPKACVNGAQALKNIYFRYLNLYEKVNFLGEDPDLKSNEEEDGPARKKICLPIETIPLSYNYNQHKLTDAQRQQHNLSTQTYEQSGYAKVEMSLQSGLPNEVDLAVNVCVLLSTEGKHCIKLEKTSRLLHLLLAHVGVFEENANDMQDLYQHCWAPNTERNFLRFWFETVDSPEVKELITLRGRPYLQKKMVGSEVLNLGRDLGTLDIEGQRVIQTAVFLHNLSFEEENQKILARSYIVYKFLMLSLHSTYGGLRQLALDTFANLSSELYLDSVDGLSTELVLDLLNNALFSEDRFFLVRGLEILGKISQLTCNESILLEHLKEDVYKRLVALLTVQDIQLIVHTLEALYKLSEVGEPFTTRIARVHKAVDTLISLITIEAQSFGPGSLVGIKVVEYVPPAHVGAEDGENMKRSTTVIQPINPDSINIYQVPASAQAQLGIIPDSGGGGGPGGGEASKEAVQVKEKEPVTDIQATTSSWLNATYELKKRSKVNQVELFSEYLQFCRKFGINNAMSSADFLHLVKVIFHQCEVISINRKNGDNDVFLEGLCKRSTQKPFAVTTLPPEKVRNPLSVNVSPKQTSSQVVDPLAHTPTLRQRLMEPPRVPLHPQLLHTGATTLPSLSASSTPAHGATKTGSQQNLPSTPAGPGKGTASLHAKITKTGKVQPASLLTSKKTLALGGNLAGTSNDGFNQITTTNQQQPSNHVLQNVAHGTSLAAAQTFPSITHALQMEQARAENADPASVKSLLAKKLSQGVSENEVQAGPHYLPCSSSQQGLQQGSFNITTNFPPTTQVSAVVSSHSAMTSQAVSVACSSSPAAVNQVQNRPVSQTVSSGISSTSTWILPASASLSTASSSSHSSLVTQSVTVSEFSNPIQNSIASAQVAQNNSVSDQLNVNPTVIQNSLNNALSQQSIYRNNGNVVQRTNTITVSGQSVNISVPRNPLPNAQNNQISNTLQFTRPANASQNTNLSIAGQQQSINVQLLQQTTNGTNVPVASHSGMQHQNTPGQANISTNQCAIMPKVVGAVQQQSNSSAMCAIAPQCSSTSVSVSSQPTPITVNHLMRNPSGMLVANHQPGSTLNNSSAVTIAAAGANIQGTTVTQSISSPAVAALLTTNSQQGSQMIISTPVISGQVQRPQTISGQAPTTVVIQTPPGTIVMPSRQLLVQGNGSTAFGSIQQGGQGGTVSFIVPSQYRQGSSVTVQGLNFIQQQGSVNVVPSLALANNTAPSQTQNLIQAVPTQQNLIQAAQNQQNLVQTSATAALTNQLAPRQIVLTPNQTTIPLGVQISSLGGNFVRNSATICVAPQQQQQQQNIVIQQPSIASSSLSLPQPSSSASVSINTSQVNPSISNVQIPIQHAESQPSRSDASLQNQQLPSAQTGNQNFSGANNADGRTQQQQQTTLPGQCNGLSHDVNGILGSPESVGSDFPPSPLSTAMGSDKEMPNGKLTEVDKETVVKRNDIGKLMDKTARMNGYLHAVDGGNHELSKQTQPESHVSKTPGMPGESQDGQMVNGCVTSAVQSSNSLAHHADIPGTQSGAVNNGGAHHQTSSQDQHNNIIRQPVAGGTVLQQGQQLIASLPQRQVVGLVQQQQLPQQVHLQQPQQIVIQQAQQLVQQSHQPQPTQQVLQPQQHVVRQVLQPQQILPQQQILQQSQQQLVQQPQQQLMQQSHVQQVLQPSQPVQQHQQVLQQPQQISQQQQQVLHQAQHQVSQQAQHQVSQQPQQQEPQQMQTQPPHVIQQHVQIQRPSQPGALHFSSQQLPNIQQQQMNNIQLQGQLRPRISTLPHQPQAAVSQTNTVYVRPALTRDISKDSEASNDSIASTTESEKSAQMATGQATQTPTSSKKKVKGKKVEVPIVPDKLPLRSRKKKDEIVVPVTQAAGQKTVHITLEYMCEWGNCRRCFSSARLVFLHVFRHHLPKSAESSCQWVSCEKLVRKRWSLVSHVQDHHCSEMAMRTACQRRYAASQQQAGGSAPATPAPHQPMIYPPDAAMQAIRRFAIKQPYAEFAEQREGPVSKHIRLTAALILRNICHCSSIGRRLIKRHEQLLSYNTMNAVEASTALSHCMWEIIHCCEQKPGHL